MFLTEIKINVTLILRSKTQIRRNFFSAAPFSFDRHNRSFLVVGQNTEYEIEKSSNPPGSRFLW